MRQHRDFELDSSASTEWPRSDERALIEAAESAAFGLSSVLTGIRPMSLVFQGYHSVHEVHRGGQGVVYRAIQSSTGRNVAIKVMHEGPFVGSHGKARFDREIRILGQLKHPNIVTIHDSGIAAGSHYFVMDRIAGQPLDVYAASAKLSVDDTLRLFVKICAAVNAAHVRGIVHRDLKPSNILIDTNGEPQILDFGLAKMEGEEIGTPTQWRSMTITGQFVGSLPWASPEQADGSPDQIDLRTDVYSLGVVLYQVLTGRFPYTVTGKMREALGNILEADPVRPSALRAEIDDEVEAIILKCLAKAPERRYQSAGELARDIDRHLAGDPIEAKRDSSLYLLRKQIWRHRTAFAVGLAFLVLLAASSVVAWTLYGQARSRLHESYFAQARAYRSSGQIGQRLDALAALAKAAAIHPTLELRDEAIACLALPDIRWGKRWRPTEPRTPEPIVGFDGDLQRYYLEIPSTGRISVRRVQDDQELVSLPEDAVTGSRAEPHFSPDGRYLARATEKACEVWDIDAARLHAAIPMKTRPGDGLLRFSPDSSTLAIADRDGTIALYEMTTGQTTYLPAEQRKIWCMEWSPQMDRMASSTIESGEVFIRDVRTGDVLQKLNHPKGVWSLGWSPTGDRLATGCDDFNAYLWDTLTGQLVHTLQGHKNVPARVQFDATGLPLVTAAWDGTTRFWDPRSGDELLKARVEVRKLAGHASQWAYQTGDGGLSIGIAEFVPSEAFSTIVADDPEDSDLSQFVWLSADGRLAATPFHAGTRLWDLGKRRYVGRAALENRTEGVDFLPDRSCMLTVSPQQVLLWPLREEEGTVGFAERAPSEVPVPRSGTEARVTPDGRTLLLGGADGTIWAIDLAEPSRRRALGTHPGVRYLSLSPDGRLLATGAWQNVDVRVWDVLKGELVHTITIPGAADVAFSPDGRWLATSECEHVLWDVRSWEPVARFPNTRYMGAAGDLAFSPDSSLLAVLVEPGTIKLIDLDRLEPVAHLRCPAPITTWGVAFTPDGSQLIIPDDARGHLLHFWDLRVLRRQLAEIGLDW